MIRETIVKAVGSLLGAKWTYSPWLADGAFQRVYEKVKAHTTIEVYRCYELWTLALQVRHLNGSYIEVGCADGGTACLIAAAAGQPVVLCDRFSDASAKAFIELAKSVGVEATVIVGVFPEDTGKAVAEMRFAMFHINVHTYAKEAAEWLWPRILSSGVLVSDECGSGSREYVQQLEQRSDRAIIHNSNGHAVMVKLL